MKRDKLLVVGAVALVLVIFFVARYFVTQSQTEQLEKLIATDGSTLMRDYNPRKGPEDARVTIVEFLDPECESCRRIYPVVERVIEENPSKVRWVVRYLPLHKNSLQAITFLEAARKQDKYWQALAKFFEMQPEWGSHEKPRPELLPGYLKSLGLDMERLHESAQDSEIGNRIQQDYLDGRKLGVTSTPTLFINGKKLTDLTYDGLKKAVDSVN